MGAGAPSPSFRAETSTIRQLGERLAINTPIQGTAADLIKKAMMDIDLAIKKEKLGAQMLLQVHDELLFEVPSQERGEATRNSSGGKWKMFRCLDVPLRSRIGWGANWTEAHAVIGKDATPCRWATAAF